MIIVDSDLDNTSVDSKFCRKTIILADVDCDIAGVDGLATLREPTPIASSAVVGAVSTVVAALHLAEDTVILITTRRIIPDLFARIKCWLSDGGHVVFA